jgi:hypothetical protein
MQALTVHTLKGAKQKVVVLQYPGLDTGASILVAPVFPASELPEQEGVTPKVNLDGEDHLVAVQRKYLGPVCGPSPITSIPSPMPSTGFSSASDSLADAGPAGG